MSFNPILATDSYKFSHAFAYPSNVEGMSAYIEARTSGRHIIVPFGLQMFVEKFLSTPITRDHIDEAEAFAKEHGVPFYREGFEYIVDKWDGYWPVTILAVPEGTPIESGNAIVVIESEDPKAYWAVTFLETALQRAIWYPTTIASRDYEIKKDIAHFYKLSGADMGLLPFAVHDFGARGVSSSESAAIGGAAHLVNFIGSDTVEGIVAANKYYHAGMAAFSVPASEHSVETAFGESEEAEVNYLNKMLDQFAKPGAIVSIVIDAYNYQRAATVLCTTLKDKIIQSGAKVVFRPDSGDMMITVPMLLEMQAKAFGYTVNSRGYKKINHVGVIQGDGVNHMSIKSLLGKILALGYSADNVIFGSGGALLQVVNRDTYKFAQKVSAVKVAGEWIGIKKDPITDPGKASKAGRLLTVIDNVTGSYDTIQLKNYDSSMHTTAMHMVYDHGTLGSWDTLDEIRARCAV
jgi:nicotinamide phosphoribosyltransferase